MDIRSKAIVMSIFLVNMLLAKPIIQDNLFCDSNNGLLSFKLNPESDSYSITKNQPFESEVRTVDKHPNCFNVRAGRSNNGKNVNWVKDKLQSKDIPWSEANATSSEYSSDNLPRKLNFALIGQLTYKHSGKVAICDNVIIGEGHLYGIAFKNNWWVFNNFTRFSHTLDCHDEEGKQVFLSLYQSGKADHIIFTFVDPR